MGFIIKNGHFVANSYSTTTSAGDNHNLRVFSSSVDIMPTNNNDAVTGFQSGLTEEGEFLFVVNGHATNNLVLKHNTGSDADNRIFTADGENLTLPPKFQALFRRLTSQSGWSEFTRPIKSPFIELTKSAVQSVPNDTTTTVSFNTESKKYLFTHDNVTNNSRITIIFPGDYEGGANMWFTTWNTITASRFNIQVFKNGVFYKELFDCAFLSNHSPSLSTPFSAPNCIAGDYFEIRVLQNTGTSRDLSATSFFWLKKVN